MPQYTLLSTWNETYRHIAELLHNIYKESAENPAQEVYDRLKETEFAGLNKGRLFRERLSRISEWGLDPIQIFASFNYPRIRERRIEIINALLKEVKSNKRIDNNTSFDGCPAPVITQIIQYRGWQAQNQIWKMFDAVFGNGIEGLTNKHFASVKLWRGIDIASFTMFLFWINSEEFIPMDQNTVGFLRSFGIITHRPRTYREYYDLCTNKLQLSQDLSQDNNIIRNFVRDAYQYADKTSSGNILSGSTATIISKRGKEGSKIEDLEIIARRKQKELVNGFQVIALRPRNPQENKEQRHLKNLKQDELYQFYHSYKFDQANDDRIIYESDKDVDLYSRGDLKISVSSIVGQNGSGKSTIAEFLYLIINKIAVAKKIKSAQKLIDEEVYADLFIKLDKLYKITVGASVKLFEYNLEADNKTYLISKNEIEIETYDLERFCYTIVVNYSLYALNTNFTGNWIYPLFHKNDSYQTPIVLNPLREEGNINVNNEEALAKSRMLSNILDPELIDFEKKIVSELLPNLIPVNLTLEFDKAKLNRKRADFKMRYVRLHNKQIEKVINALGINEITNPEYAKETKEYIYLKIITIADRYSKFRKFKNLPTWVSNSPAKLKEYIEKLSQETSHITFKLKQAINYLKYGIYKAGVNNNIVALSEQIQDIKETTGLPTIELVPPSFFETNLFFDHGGTFNDLSSGEKQQIFSINTITYHIYNIASVMYERDVYKYNNINIVFDEVELYFHPEMQRTYINNLLHRISTLPLKGSIHNINMLFITHSPFILSDIPSSNILRLTTDQATRKAIPVANLEQTFGANIHDLLANDFFLQNGFMGKFANDKIHELIEKIEKWKSGNTDSQLKIKDELYKTIQLIGEPLVKESLMDMYREKIGLHESEISFTDIDAEIKRLQELKEKMR